MKLWPPMCTGHGPWMHGLAHVVGDEVIIDNLKVFRVELNVYSGAFRTIDGTVRKDLMFGVFGVVERANNLKWVQASSDWLEKWALEHGQKTRAAGPEEERRDDLDAMDEENCKNPASDEMEEGASDSDLSKLLATMESPTDANLPQEPAPKSTQHKRPVKGYKKRTPGF
ncbi:hypothetical protein N7454_002916 [Penicillium verhagenii]|nr:hypothetical protein N7454_002916 [Penicillium verhagenii]